MTRKRKICVATGTRAEYGLLKHLMKAINESDEFELVLFVTGTHLAREYGETYREIEADGFLIDEKIDIKIYGDEASDVANSTAYSVIGFSDAFKKICPDLVVLLGDRYEIFGAAISAMFHKIPIAHLHGGELTKGAMDDSIRHSLTKLSHIHFVANDVYRKRVIQLGENPENVFNVGGLGVDAINRITLLSREELMDKLNIRFKKKNLLVTFHPETLQQENSSTQIKELLKALAVREDSQIIFTMPNADPNNKILADMIKKFVQERKNASLFYSLGQTNYFSCISQVDAVIGNSSSGLLEVPSFKKATINIGDRQSGRLKALSVLDCAPDFCSINEALNKIYTAEFQRMLETVENPYGHGGAVDLIMHHLKSISFKNLLIKGFCDVQ